MSRPQSWHPPYSDVKPEDLSALAHATPATEIHYHRQSFPNIYNPIPQPSWFVDGYQASQFHQNQYPYASALQTHNNVLDSHPVHSLDYLLPAPQYQFPSVNDQLSYPDTQLASATATPPAKQQSAYRTPETHHRVRTAHACEKCRIRKAKCTGDSPSCKRCLIRGLECVYAPDGTGTRRAKSKDVKEKEKQAKRQKSISPNSMSRFRVEQSRRHSRTPSDKTSPGSGASDSSPIVAPSTAKRAATLLSHSTQPLSRSHTPNLFFNSPSMATGFVGHDTFSFDPFESSHSAPATPSSELFFAV